MVGTETCGGYCKASRWVLRLIWVLRMVGDKWNRTTNAMEEFRDEIMS
jgi:hypothetical protein